MLTLWIVDAQGKWPPLATPPSMDIELELTQPLQCVDAIENVMVVLIKIEKTNTMTNTWGETKTRITNNKE